MGCAMDVSRGAVGDAAVNFEMSMSVKMRSYEGRQHRPEGDVGIGASSLCVRSQLRTASKLPRQ